jgi:hypothetical protein
MLPFFVLAASFSVRRWQMGRGFRVLFGLLGAWSLIATWGLTLAEQAFPPDFIFNPLFEYALPNWQAGNVARNLGVLIGLRGPVSVLPLIGLWVAALGVFWLKPFGGRAAPLPLPQTGETA